jgi:hypothetical protein
MHKLIQILVQLQLMQGRPQQTHRQILMQEQLLLILRQMLIQVQRLQMHRPIVNRY